MSFGKAICPTCKDSRPKLLTGNSGLTNTGQEIMSFSEGLSLMRVPKSHGLFGNLYFSHYPKSKGIVGRCICYLIFQESQLMGIISGSSPPLNYKHFNNIFGKGNEKYFLNNNAFRLIVNIKNLATQVLKLFRRQIKNDYYLKYGDVLLGLVTFVEPPRTGSCYKADNWIEIGTTEGKRMRRNPISWNKTFVSGIPKKIFAYKYKVVTQACIGKADSRIKP